MASKGRNLGTRSGMEHPHTRIATYRALGITYLMRPPACGRCPLSSKRAVRAARVLRCHGTAPTVENDVRQSVPVSKIREQ